MGQARNKAETDRIDRQREHDRNGGGDALECRDDRCAVGEDHIGRERYQFLGIAVDKLLLAGRPAVFDVDVLAVPPAEVRETLSECGEAFLVVGSAFVARHQHADHGHAARLLRARRARPGDECAAEERDELAPPHSITSSAVICMIIGTVRPSVFAVLRLSTNSNLVDCITGRSAGFSPLRIFPA